MNGNDIFDELFVLEMANNHLGDLQRGLKIISNYAQVVRFNNVRAAIKLQLRDVDTFIHKDFRQRDDIRYIKKTLDTRLQTEDFATMVQAIREASCIRWQRRSTRVRLISVASSAFPYSKSPVPTAMTGFWWRRSRRQRNRSSSPPEDHRSKTSTTWLHSSVIVIFR